MMEIILVRHGKTSANEKRLYCGRTDLPLSEAGAEEIAALKSGGIYPPADVYFTSGLLRCEQTLDIVHGKVKRKAVPELAEFDFGRFELKSYEQLKDRDDYQSWITDETGDFPCPGGESRNQFKKRALGGFEAVLDEVRQGAFGSALVVCHGGTIVSIMERLCPGTRNFYEWQPGPGRGYALVYVSGRFCSHRDI